MKLKKTTWILMITALILIASVALYEISRKNQEANDIAAQKIFNTTITEEQIRQIIITKPDVTLEFIRVAEQDNSWSMIQPEKILANEAVIAFLTDLIVTGTSDRVIPFAPTSLAEYGLEQPSATISFTTTDDQTHKIVLGQSTIGDRFIYAQVFFPDKITDNILLVSPNWHYAVDREDQEWSQESD